VAAPPEEWQMKITRQMKEAGIVLAVLALTFLYLRAAITAHHAPVAAHQGAR